MLRQEHLRPQFVRGAWQCLNGELGYEAER